MNAEPEVIDPMEPGWQRTASEMIDQGRKFKLRSQPTEEDTYNLLAYARSKMMPPPPRFDGIFTCDIAI
jgi:hypothetical protein